MSSRYPFATSMLECAEKFNSVSNPYDIPSNSIRSTLEIIAAKLEIEEDTEEYFEIEDLFNEVVSKHYSIEKTSSQQVDLVSMVEKDLRKKLPTLFSQSGEDEEMILLAAYRLVVRIHQRRRQDVRNKMARRRKAHMDEEFVEVLDLTENLDNPSIVKVGRDDLAFKDKHIFPMPRPQKRMADSFSKDYSISRSPQQPEGVPSSVSASQLRYDHGAVKWNKARKKQPLSMPSSSTGSLESQESMPLFTPTPSRQDQLSFEVANEYTDSQNLMPSASLAVGELLLKRPDDFAQLSAEYSQNHDIKNAQDEIGAEGFTSTPTPNITKHQLAPAAKVFDLKQPQDSETETPTLSPLQKFLQACDPPMDRLLPYFKQSGCATTRYLHAIAKRPADDRERILRRIVQRGIDNGIVEEIDILLLEAHWGDFDFGASH